MSDGTHGTHGTDDTNREPSAPAPHRDDVDGVAKVAELVKGARIAMLTTVSADGALVSRPMAAQEKEFDGDAWFFSAADSPKVVEIEADPRVNVAFSEKHYVSLSGTAVVVRDPERKRELWNQYVAAWFHCEPEDPQVVLIKLEAQTAEYWESPSGPVTMLKVARAKLTGDTPQVGANAVVDL